MKHVKKLLAVVMATVMVLSCMVFSAVAEDRIYCTGDLNPQNLDGGAFASGISVAIGSNEHEIILTEHESGVNRCLWAFLNGTVETYPYLYIELENPEACQKITISKHWDVQPEVELEIKEGLFCVPLYEMLADWESTVGYTYVVPYVNLDQTLTIKQMYLSNVDENGNIYVKPTQPRAMWNVGGTMQRFDLPAYTKDTLYEMVDDTYGYGWLMSAGLKISEHEDGKGFWMERADDSNATAGNIAWVVPYEQLEKTPYLVFDFANKGRPDEGPQVSIYAYWEGIQGSLATFDDMGVKYHGANGLNGVCAYNLKYAVDNVKEELHGKYGIAIIVALNWANERTDGTILDPLKIDDAYLMGWEGGEEIEFTFAEVMNNGGVVPTTPTQSTQTTTTVANQNDDDDDKANDDNGWIVWAIVGAVVVIGAVVVAVVIKKKK